MKKKIAIVCVTVAVAVAVTVMSVCLALFLPRKVSRLVPLNGVESVTVSYLGRGVSLTVSNEQFLQVLNGGKYRLRYSQVKATSPYKITLNYESGSVITVDGWWIKTDYGTDSERDYAIELTLNIEQYLLLQ
ncbi:MAG: hypothetical protein K2H78_01955 [Clostridia bacterium]|nr:hypothetical protein [Clostridia bacterium]